YTGAGITTVGGNGAGILANSSGIGSIDVSSTGPITTNGSRARGVFADSGGGPITVTASGAISTQGADSPGIWATSTTGPVQVSATNISTKGEFSAGIKAAGGGTTVNVAQGGSVMGGWQADLISVGMLGLPAAGVILDSTGGPATLTNNGSIGALSDRAVAGDPQVINNNTITGFVQFTGDNNSITNNNTFNLRHFADTNGDGIRDTLRVAVSNLGGTTNTFTNNGTLALLGGPG